MRLAELRSWSARAGAALVLALFAATARAEAPAPASANEVVERERATTRVFYGWKILATGEVGGVLAASATILAESPTRTAPSTAAFLIGMPLFALGGPATHWSHDDFSKGLVSLGANFVLPLAGGLIGNAAYCGQADSTDSCGTRGFFSGFAIALVTVPVADALILGWQDLTDDDPVPPESAPAAPPRGASVRPHKGSDSAAFPRRPRALFTMAPAWSVGPRGELAFGLTGRF